MVPSASTCANAVSHQLGNRAAFARMHSIRVAGVVNGWLTPIWQNSGQCCLIAAPDCLYGVRPGMSLAWSPCRYTLKKGRPITRRLFRLAGLSAPLEKRPELQPLFGLKWNIRQFAKLM